MQQVEVVYSPASVKVKSNVTAGALRQCQTCHLVLHFHLILLCQVVIIYHISSVSVTKSQFSTNQLLAHYYLTRDR